MIGMHQASTRRWAPCLFGARRGTLDPSNPNGMPSLQVEGWNGGCSAVVQLWCWVTRVHDPSYMATSAGLQDCSAYSPIHGVT